MVPRKQRIDPPLLLAADDGGERAGKTGQRTNSIEFARSNCLNGGCLASSSWHRLVYASALDGEEKAGILDALRVQLRQQRGR
jgi:hypothetical protein